MGYGITTKFLMASIPKKGKNAVMNTREQAKKGLPSGNRFSVFDAEIDEDETLDLLKELPLFSLEHYYTAGPVWRRTVLTNPRPVKAQTSKFHFAYRIRQRNDAFDDSDQAKAKADFIDDWVEERMWRSKPSVVHKNLLETPWLLAESAGCSQEIVDLAHSL